MKKAHELHELTRISKEKMHGCMPLVLCRGLIYQAQPQAIHFSGLMNQTPTGHEEPAQGVKIVRVCPCSSVAKNCIFSR